MDNHLGRTKEAISLAAIAIEREPSFHYLPILKAELELTLGLNEDAERSLGDLQLFSEDNGALMRAIQMKIKLARLHPGRERELHQPLNRRFLSRIGLDYLERARRCLTDRQKLLQLIQRLSGKAVGLNNETGYTQSQDHRQIVITSA